MARNGREVHENGQRQGDTGRKHAFSGQIELSIHRDDLPVGIQVVGLIYTAAFAMELLLRISVFGCSPSTPRKTLGNRLENLAKALGKPRRMNENE